MNLTELKCAAYDCLANIEHLQKQLQQINQAIAAELQKPKDENPLEKVD